MSQPFEVRLNEKEAAHYFSNAAALYVLGIGFAVFTVKAQGAFLSGACFWFSIFFLCDCFRLARVCARLSRTQNLLLVADPSGITHYVSWLEPEHRAWKEIHGYRSLKAPTGELIFFQVRARPGQFLRVALFGAPKFDLPLSCVPGGQATLLERLAGFPDAKHLLPDSAPEVRIAA